MNELSPTAQAFVAKARGARLGESHKSRLRASLATRIAVTAAAGATATTVATTSTAATACATSAATAVTGLGGVGLAGKVVIVAVATSAVVWGAREALTNLAPARSEMHHLPVAAIVAAGTKVAHINPPPPLASPLDSPPQPSPFAAAPNVRPEASAEPTAPSLARALAPRVHSTAVNGRRSSEAISIANEVALLRESQTALARGDPSGSLGAIDALAARHPDGPLREEREAERVLALCAAGRVDEAAVDAQRFLARTPKSVQAARVRASCAFAR